MDTLPPPRIGDAPARSLVDRVVAVVALKTLPAAKSRLSALPDPLRERLARCMAIDTLAALRPAVREIVVVSDQPDLAPALRRRGLDVRLLAEPDPAASVAHVSSRGSLNLALAHADSLLRADGVETVLACVGDLPALRTRSVQQVIVGSRAWSRSFLTDHDELGTTMLVARGVPLDPFYGTEISGGQRIGSSVRHAASGAVALALGALPDARRDVDTTADLATAAGLGVGAATASLLDPTTGALGAYQPVEVLSGDGTHLTVLVDGVARTLPFDGSTPLQTYDGDPALVVPGRRLHAVRVADDLRCWA